MPRFGDDFDDPMNDEYNDLSEDSTDEADEAASLSADDPLRAMTSSSTLTAAHLPTEVTDEVVRFYSPLVWKLALTKTRSTHDAQDIFQDVFVKLVMHEKPFESEEHRKAWLIRVTINCAKDLLRSKSSWEELNESIVAEESPALGSEEQLDLHTAIRQLRFEYREVICLHYLEGLSIKDIAVVLGRNENTIKTHLARGREKLRKFLED